MIEVETMVAPLAKTGIDVVVTARPRTGGGVDYDLSIKSHGNGGKIDLPRDSGVYEIRFDLDAKDGLDIRFDAAGPFFCHDDLATCPTSLDTAQMMVDSCDKAKLVVVDWNYGPTREYRYQLNFVDKWGEALEPLDPIIKNGGGIPPRR